MYIKELSIQNFKSIENAQIDFSPLSIVVGANAAGKSNLINVFRFIEDILVDGLENAIALQGGIQYLSNVNMPKGEKIRIAFTIDLLKENWIRHLQNKGYSLKVKEIDYEFIIQPNKRGLGYHIDYDYIKITYDCYEKSTFLNKKEEYTNLNIQYSTTFERSNRKTLTKLSKEFTPKNNTSSINMDSFVDNGTEFFLFLLNEEKKNNKREELMLYRLYILLPPYFSENAFIRVFDFDPKELKKPSSIASRKNLEEDGSNIASILQTILRNKEKTKELTSLLQRFLPFIDSISVKNNFDKSLFYKVKESYNKNPFHANFLSDGTVSILALILALYFEEESYIIILEEPERNIHPKLLADLISSAEDVSKEKQVILTTHNPEMLKHTDLKNIRFVSRDSNGRTIITTPANSSIVNEFIKNDLGIDDLFIQELLED